METIKINGHEIKADTQKGRMVQYLIKHGSITAREAFIKLYINSPRKVLSDLREMGLIREENVNVYRLNSQMEKKVKTHYRRYYLNNREGKLW